MYVEVEVDDALVIDNLSDSELLEEVNRRGLALHDNELTDEDLSTLHEALRYKGPEVALQKLSTLIYERLGKIA